MKNLPIKFLITVLVFQMNNLIGQHFTPVWETPFNPMTVFVIEASLNGVPLVGDDEIAVFDLDGNGGEICVGSIILDAPIPEGEFVQIICSMDDGLDPEQPNGFTTNNDFIFRYWIEAPSEEVEGVMFSFPFPDYDEQFSALGTAIVSLSAETQVPEVHWINLEPGWTGISTYLNPTNPEMEEIFAAIEDELVIIKNLAGDYYTPTSANNLANWEYQQGYFIKMQNQNVFEILGYAPVISDIQVVVGWNLIPVLKDDSVSVEVLFEGNLNKIEIIKDAVGINVYWPSKNISTLQFLQTGNGYLVKASQPFTISF